MGKKLETVLVKNPANPAIQMRINKDQYHPGRFVLWEESPAYDVVVDDADPESEAISAQAGWILPEMPTVEEIEAMGWREIKMFCEQHGFDEKPEDDTWESFLIAELYGVQVAEIIGIIGGIVSLGSVAWTVLLYIPKLMVEAYSKFDHWNNEINRRITANEKLIGEIKDECSKQSDHHQAEIEKLEMRLDYKIDMGYQKLTLTLERISDGLHQNQSALTALHKRLDKIYGGDKLD